MLKNFFFRSFTFLLQLNLEIILFIKYFLFFFEYLIAIVKLDLPQILLRLFGWHQIVLSYLIPFQILLFSFHISFFILEVHLYQLLMINLTFSFLKIFSLLLKKLKQMNQSLPILIIPFPFHHYLPWPHNQISHFN